jgi:hypothetical protein
VWGTKFVLMLARGEAPHSRMILDVEWVEKSGGEAAVTMRHPRTSVPRHLGRVRSPATAKG